MDTQLIIKGTFYITVQRNDNSKKKKKGTETTSYAAGKKKISFNITKNKFQTKTQTEVEKGLSKHDTKARNYNGKERKIEQ